MTINFMKKLQLYKAAIDFAFDNVEETNSITLAEKSIAVFKAGGFAPEDLTFWEQTQKQAIQQFNQLKKQKLPSEQVKATAPMQAATEAAS